MNKTIQTIIKSIRNMKLNRNEQVLVPTMYRENKSGGIAEKTANTDILRYLTQMWKSHLEATGKSGKEFGLIEFGNLVVKATRFSELYPGFLKAGLERKASFQSKALRLAYNVGDSAAPFSQAELLAVFQAMAETLPGVTKRAEVKVIKKAEQEEQPAATKQPARRQTRKAFVEATA